VRKQVFIDLIDAMPEDIDPEDLMYHLYVLAKIQKAEKSIEEHGLIPDEEIDRAVDSWPE
jgi:hypothetical protein